MKRRNVILAALTISVLMLAGQASVGAGSTRKVTGGYQYSLPDLGVHGWVEVNVHELAGGAKGKMQEQVYHEDWGWWRSKGHAVCIAFGEADDGAPAAAIVVQVDRDSGWGAGNAGKYFKFWLTDGGTPATAGDKVTLIVWPPVAEQPSCDYEEPNGYPIVDLVAGDVVIHH